MTQTKDTNASPESAEEPQLTEKIGGADGIRTHDLLDAIEARFQLRHGPTGRMSFYNTGVGQGQTRRCTSLHWAITSCIAAGPRAITIGGSCHESHF